MSLSQINLGMGSGLALLRSTIQDTGPGPFSLNPVLRFERVVTFALLYASLYINRHRFNDAVLTSVKAPGTPEHLFS
jgi:hypothetical protein